MNSFSFNRARVKIKRVKSIAPSLLSRLVVIGSPPHRIRAISSRAETRAQTRVSLSRGAEKEEENKEATEAIEREPFRDRYWKKIGWWKDMREGKVRVSPTEDAPANSGLIFATQPRVNRNSRHQTARTKLEEDSGTRLRWKWISSSTPEFAPFMPFFFIAS